MIARYGVSQGQGSEWMGEWEDPAPREMAVVRGQSAWRAGGETRVTPLRVLGDAVRSIRAGLEI